MKINLNIFAKVVSLFLLTQALGIFVAYKILPTLKQPLITGAADFSFWDIGLTILFAFILFFISSKFPKAGGIMFKIFLSVVILSTSQLVFEIWFSAGIALAIASALLIIFWLWRSALVHNLVMVIALAGVGAILGTALSPLIAAAILVAFSFYDIIAVYRTGHMIKLAEMMVEAKAVFGFIIPEKTGTGNIILGSGDVALPLLLVASVARYSIEQAVVVAIFAAVGVFFTHVIFSSQSERKPMAALPPIATMAIIGYLVAIIFNL